jgi:predicted metal-dependent hydrolase
LYTKYTNENNSPKEGDANSHRYILQREADYLGVSISQEDVQALLNEITSLRQQVLETQQIINDLTNK